MTEQEIQCLKDNIDKTVEIETISGERLIAKVLFVSHSDEYDEHDVTYEMIFSNKPEVYASYPDAGAFNMDFGAILSVKSYAGSGTKVGKPESATGS